MDSSTVKARFTKELTSNNSLTWFNRNAHTALAQAVAGIRTLVIGDPVTYPVTTGAPVRDAGTCLFLYLRHRYGY